MPTAQVTMKRRSVQPATRADMKHVMPALAVARQLDLDAEERIGVAENVEPAHCCCTFPCSAAAAISAASFSGTIASGLGTSDGAIAP